MLSLLGSQLRNLGELAAAIGEMGHSRVLLDRIGILDRELEDINGRLLNTQPDSIQIQLKEIREFVVSQLSNIRK